MELAGPCIQACNIFSGAFWNLLSYCDGVGVVCLGVGRVGSKGDSQDATEEEAKIDYEIVV